MENQEKTCHCSNDVLDKNNLVTILQTEIQRLQGSTVLLEKEKINGMHIVSEARANSLAILEIAKLIRELI